MYDKDFKVKLISSKNSFVFLSEHDSRLIDHEHMIRLSYGINKRAFFSLGTSLSSLKEGELAIGSVMAKELGIIKNDIVSLSTTKYIATIRRLKLLTASDDDYEMLVLLAETVQSTLLNQVKIVHDEQKLVIWISNSLHVTVIVDGVQPISPGKLEMLTEVAILPPEKKAVSNHATTVKRTSVSGVQKASIMNVYNQTQCALRLHPVERLPASSIGDKKAFIEQPFSALLSKRNFERLAGPYRTHSHRREEPLVLVTLRIISPPTDVKELLDETHEVPESVTVRLFCIDEDDENEKEHEQPKEKTNDDELLKQSNNDFIELSKIHKMADVLYVHKFLFDYFHVTTGAKVLCKIEPMKNFVPKLIEIVTSSKFFNKADELVRNYLCSYCLDGGIMVLNSGLVMQEPAQQCRFMLKFTPANEKYLIVSQNIMRECKFKLSEVELVESSGNETCQEKQKKTLELCLDASNYQQIVEDIVKCLTKEDSSVILTGKTGCGKTSLTSKIAEVMSTAVSHHYVEVVQCRKLKGKTIESLLKQLNAIFVRLIYYQPAVLILDDLHVICEKVIEGEQPTQENLHFNKVSEMLSQELEHLLRRNNISLFATTESMGKLNVNIYNSRGKHLFKNCFSINELNKDDRITILKYLFNKKEINAKNINYDHMGTKTEGFLMQDLLDLVDKIIFEVYKSTNCDNVEKELVINDSHCEIALSNASTLSLRQVQLHSPGDRDFDDIGGLEDVKRILIETMLWPAQYSNIFANSPLRLQSGVLLYGPPGTGKTILAGAAAKQCNLRLISVKGPELLSKYIGASEQAVRDIFQKAQSAKPCILFFDEFDSLAPRRGHDNTGVTDRVVNQFLTQLDGVESLTGVCVLAATSRPDLLDPALLRPGRLDRQILCPMPDKTSRCAILTALSKKLNLSKDIKLDQIADQTEGFSGADLQAVLYTAQLNSVDHLLQSDLTTTTLKPTLKTSKTKNTKTDKNLLADSISLKHLEDAVRATRPSLTRDERTKYERIYQKFQGKSDVLDSLKSGKQKATLA